VCVVWCAAPVLSVRKKRDGRNNAEFGSRDVYTREDWGIIDFRRLQHDDNNNNNNSRNFALKKSKKKKIKNQKIQKSI
jgi:ABC-type antimicrobial peptide transport system permease subunit